MKIKLYYHSKLYRKYVNIKIVLFQFLLSGGSTVFINFKNVINMTATRWQQLQKREFTLLGQFLS